jgi:hypothetical protein
MARATSRLFENHKQIFLRVLNGEQTLRARAITAYERKTREFGCRSELFSYFSGITPREESTFTCRPPAIKLQTHRPDITLVFYFENLRLCRIQVHSGGVFSNFCPEIEPICFATRNSQSRCSVNPSIVGTPKGEDVVSARLHGCTEWLADLIASALPTHPHVHIAVE